MYESMGSLSDAAISDLASTVTSITRQVRVGPALQVLPKQYPSERVSSNFSAACQHFRCLRIDFAAAQFHRERVLLASPWRTSLYHTVCATVSYRLMTTPVQNC